MKGNYIPNGKVVVVKRFLEREILTYGKLQRKKNALKLVSSKHYPI